MSTEWNLDVAYRWTCDACGRDNFGKLPNGGADAVKSVYCTYCKKRYKPFAFMAEGNEKLAEDPKRVELIPAITWTCCDCASENFDSVTVWTGPIPDDSPMMGFIFGDLSIVARIPRRLECPRCGAVYLFDPRAKEGD